MAPSCFLIHSTSAMRPARATVRLFLRTPPAILCRLRPVVLFEYPQSYHLSMDLETIDEARPSKLVWSSVSGKDEGPLIPLPPRSDLIAGMQRDEKIGLAAGSHLQALALEAQGLDVRDCQAKSLRSRRENAGRSEMPANQHGGAVQPLRRFAMPSVRA